MAELPAWVTRWTAGGAPPGSPERSRAGSIEPAVSVSDVSPRMDRRSGDRPVEEEKPSSSHPYPTEPVSPATNGGHADVAEAADPTPEQIEISQLRDENKRQAETIAAIERRLAASCASRADLASLLQPSGEVILIGDIHGHAAELEALWDRLTEMMGEVALAKATVIFLGDYCDRGPNTKGVLDFIVSLRASRPADRTHFIAGNHDLGMAAFLGCLPIDDDHPPIDLDATKDPAFDKGFWPHEVEGGMHYQGRRWAEGKVYKCKTTFNSYGVPFEDGAMDPLARESLLSVVPASHLDFLRSLKWVHEQRVPDGEGWGGITDIMCVHAGLASERPLDAQLDALRRRDLTSEILLGSNGKGGIDKARLTPMIDRSELLQQHPDLLNSSTLLCSGHHGIAYQEDNRIVLDRSGGKIDKSQPLEAMILPSRTVVGHDGSTRSLTKEWVGTNIQNNGKQLKKMEAKVREKGGEWICLCSGTCPGYDLIDISKKK